MRGWIIYERADTAPNRAFIDYWQEAARARGVDLPLVCTDALCWGVRGGRLFLTWNGAEARPAFVVMRAKQPLLSRHLELLGVRVFNNAKTSEILNDKRRTHAAFSGLAPMLDTAFLTADLPCPFPYPVVVKGASGCGGRQVRLCANAAEYRAVCADFGDQGVVQPLCDTPGVDLRIYMLGTRPLQAMLRRSSDQDIRANFGIHHTAEPTEAPRAQIALACGVAAALGSTFIGVDFIRHKGQWLFNEAEDAVGTRMLYRYTDIDIVPLYLDSILQSL